MLLKLLAILPFALHGLGHPTFSPAENHTHAHDGNTPKLGLTDHQSSTPPKGMSFQLPEGMNVSNHMLHGMNMSHVAKRTAAQGVYECAGANWTPPCSWRQAGDHCMNATYSGVDYSWGPDKGLSCEMFLTASCGATKKDPYVNAGQLMKAGNRFITPGISSFANSPSWKAAVTGLYWGDEYKKLPAKSFHCKPTSACDLPGQVRASYTLMNPNCQVEQDYVTRKETTLSTVEIGQTGPVLFTKGAMSSFIVVEHEIHT